MFQGLSFSLIKAVHELDLGHCEEVQSISSVVFRALKDKF